MQGKLFYQQGILCLNEGKWNDALIQFNKALDLEPDQPDYLGDRAVAYFQLGKTDLAIIDLNQAQKIDPKNPYRYSSRAFVKDSLGDTKGAIADYEKAIELDPEDAVAYNNLGMLEEKLGYQKKAAEKFKKADELAHKMEEGKSNEFVMMTKSEKTKPNSPLGKEEAPRSRWHFMKYGIFNKKGRKEFLQFIKNGFKIK